MLDQTTINNYHRICQEIAMSLSLSWTPSQINDEERQNHEYVHRHQVITDKNGRSFTLSFDGWQNKGRIKVYGNYPRYMNGQIIGCDGKPEITISYTRSTATIAAEIQRRFIPAFVKVWDHCQDIRHKHDTNILHTRQHLELIQKATKAYPHHSSGIKAADELKESHALLHHPRTGQIQVFADGHSYIERLNIQDVETLIELLRLIE